MTDRRSALLERPVMRDEFRRELRSRLLSEAAVALAPAPRRWTSLRVLRPVLAAAAAFVLIVVGATGAAASSLPGDALYSVKRASENVVVAFTFDDLARMELLSDIADRRLAELAEIARRTPSGAPTATQEYADAVGRFAEALDKLRTADSADKRDAAKALAEAARAKHKAVLDAVKEGLPQDLQPDVDRVIEDEEQRTAPNGDERHGNQGGGQGGDNGRSNGPPAKTPKK
ncbi:MAG TPA: DUF5667 domain-containing protein [Candidatus Limnocylindria bacterium]|jgi:hypothetical protein